MNFYSVKRFVRKEIPLLKYRYIPKGDMNGFKVHIVNYDPIGWIFTKFANEMCSNLKEFGINVTVSDKIDPKADINHHIFYEAADLNLNNHSTVMITHVDCERKYQILKKQFASGAMGICMSKDTMNKLVDYGLPRSNLCYINPAQDALITPKKYVIGITHRVYKQDYRKRDEAIIDVCKGIDSMYFKFKIMGNGWEKIVEEMKKLGFDVEYNSEFDKAKYNVLMPSLDFFYYDGTDEGNMGYLDALAAGVKTLVTAQGFHLDMGPATHYCNTVDDFINVLNSYADERKKIVSSVKDATWNNYTYKHLEIWEYMTKRIDMETLLQNRTFYSDGIYSCLLPNIHESKKIKGIL